MARYKPSFLEWLTLFMMFPVMITTAGYQLYGKRYFTVPEVYLGSTLLMGIVSISFWYLYFSLIQNLAKIFTELSDMWKRVTTLIMFDIVVVMLNMAIVFYGFDALHLFGYKFSHQHFMLSCFIGIIVTVIGITLCESEYIFKKWKESLALKERAQMQIHEQEFENLIRQINPHFLFNNLNALSSLITTNPAKAEFFLDELSKVYRYLMRNNQEALSTLRQEIAFIQSYMTLLQIRYQDAVYLHVAELRNYEDRLLPSLSLQLLVENAVKHNMARKSHPLIISIYLDEQEKLVVENNLQVKPGKITSNNVGLSNISVKYRLINQPDAIVEKDEQIFRVRLALLHRSTLGENQQKIMNLLN
jgi:two-component system LytT family sensor kinase